MRKDGFTLIELLVVLAVLSLVLAAVLQSYINILKSYKNQSSISKSNIDKLITFELIRRDIENCGFGLDINNSPISYNGSLLVLRSTLLLRNSATKCFGYIDPSSIKFFTIEASDITSSNCNDTSFCYVALDLDYNLNSTCYNITLNPANGVYLLFGLLDSTSSINRPYNEIQYSLSNSHVLTTCAPGTFELTRKEILANGNSSGAQPIFDCVKDFKVAFGLDTNGDGAIDQWTTTLPGTPSDIRTQVKEINVIILYHEGRRDLDFNYSQGTIYLNATSSLVLGQFTPTGDELHYRWKVAKITITPMNFRRENR
ncbi:hypothetical protein JCM12298_15990 [Desulfothermus naphthae]